MATIKIIPRRRRGPSFRGRVMVDTFLGRIRVRKWPKKRGPPTSESQRFWVSWFTQANRLAKYADAMTQARAIELTKGTGQYPRDIILQAMRGRLYWWATPDGQRYYSMAAIGDISETFDVLAQKLGSIMVRAVERWRALDAGVLGQRLTSQGPEALPIWQAPSGGITQAELAESPITPDGSVSEYVFDVTVYLAVEFVLDNVDIAGADTIKFRLSTDGGLTYHTGATDYFSCYLNTVTEACAYADRFDLSDGSASADHRIRLALKSLLAPQMSWDAMVAHGGASTAQRAGWPGFDGPVTHVKIYTLTAKKFSAGLIRAMGAKAA